MFTLGFTPELVRPIIESHRQKLLRTAKHARALPFFVLSWPIAKYPIRVNIGKALVAIGQKLQEPYSANAWDMPAQI